MPHERMPEVQMVILTSCDDQRMMLEAIGAGAVAEGMSARRNGLAGELA